MEVTRNVILDLLPLYLANEASEDTNALVREYLENDSELAGIAKKLKSDELTGGAPVPLTEEDKMKAYKEAKRLLFQRTITLAAIISAAVVVILVLAALAWFFFKG
jgi:hypothetical protein